MIVISLVLLSSAILSTICSPHEFIDACWDWTVCVCRIDSNVWRDDNKLPSAVLRAGIQLVWAINLSWRAILIFYESLLILIIRGTLSQREHIQGVRGHVTWLGNRDEEIFAITKRCTEYRTGLCTNLSSLIQERNNLSHIQMCKSFVLTSFANNEKVAIINTEAFSSMGGGGRSSNFLAR